MEILDRFFVMGKFTGKAHVRANTRHAIEALMALSLLLLFFPLAVHATNNGSKQPPAPQVAAAKNATLQLGSIKVYGKRDILHVLEDLKFALRQPYSSDPRLADVEVCRLLPKAGSHIMGNLICGTNRALNKNRDMLQTNAFLGKAASNACGGGGTTCQMNVIFTTLNEYALVQSAPTIRATVNMAAFRGLLAKVPDPDSAAEVMRLGSTEIHGQRNILHTLEAIKVALQEPVSRDPNLAGTVVCRFHDIGSDQVHQILECSTNRTLSRVLEGARGIAVAAVSGAVPPAVPTLDSIVASAPGGELQAKVDGPALRALLAGITSTAATRAPTAATQP